MAGPPRVVNDTGKTAKIIHLIEDKSVISITSDFILQEVKEKLMEFGTPAYAASGTINYISSISIFIRVDNISQKT